jgi:outer membrane lipopolysaccharide assembly protein LptE/RlpB
MSPGSFSALSRRKERGLSAGLPAVLAAASLAVLLLGGAGCGYHLQPGGKTRFSDPAVRMDLAPFTNDSSEADAGAYLAARLREALRRSGYRGSFGRTGADYLVEGRIREIPDDVFSHGADRFALENRLTLVVDIRVIDARGGGVLWKAAGLRETASYFSGPDAQYTAANRRAAFEETARRLVLRMAQTIRVVL